MKMDNIEGKVFKSEWSEINEDTGLEKVHEHRMYFLNDEGEEVILDRYKDKIRSIVWTKVSDI